MKAKSLSFGRDFSDAKHYLYTLIIEITRQVLSIYCDFNVLHNTMKDRKELFPCAFLFVILSVS